MHNKDFPQTGDHPGVAVPALAFREATGTPAPPADAIVDAWFAQFFHGIGPKLDTELYNTVYGSKEALKQQLAHLHA